MPSNIDTSGIDETKPLDGVPAVKQDLRENLAAIKTNQEHAKTEIEALQNAIVYSAYTVNVKDPQFAGGAVGDGVADDTAAVRAAYDSIPEGFGIGGTLFFPAGIYRFNLNVDRQLHLTIAGEQFGSTIRSATADGWVVVFPIDSNRTHRVRDITVRPATTGFSNGIAVGNASGVDFENVRFHRNAIGLHLYLTSYGNHINTSFFANNIGLLFSKKGGTITNPNTTLAFPADDSRNNNISNKLFIGCGFTANDVGVLFDYESCTFINANRFIRCPFEQHDVAIASNFYSVNPYPAATLSAHRNVFVDGWFESNGVGAGTVDVLNDTFSRGDIHIKGGGTFVEGYHVERAEVSDAGYLTLKHCDLWVGGGSTANIRKTGTGILDLKENYRIPGTFTNHPTADHKADVLYPLSRDVTSGWVRPFVHGFTMKTANCQIGSDCTGASLPTGLTFSGVTSGPTLQVADGPFGECIEVGVTASSGAYMQIALGFTPVVDRFYLFLWNVQSSTATSFRKVLGQITLTQTGVDTNWNTLGGVCRFPDDTPVSTVRIGLDEATTTLRIGGFSVVDCGSETEVLEILRTGSMPIPF